MTQILFKVNDTIKVHVHVYSNTDKDILGKPPYQVKGPFCITQVLDDNSYWVQRYNNSEGSTHKYKEIELYFLPLILFRSNPLDIINLRYIGYSHAPIP